MAFCVITACAARLSNGSPFNAAARHREIGIAARAADRAVDVGVGRELPRRMDARLAGQRQHVAQIGIADQWRPACSGVGLLGTPVVQAHASR